MEVEKNVFASVVEAMILKVSHLAVVDVNNYIYYTMHSVYTVKTKYSWDQKIVHPR